ncbi:MAG: SDR family oxidoreductase [Proteobacteria bacterium]|nr:SDR family oxidoreductase [Desulfobulbaceae bacterium]MBU4152226.1 SDR family oxidoreductase [Pseudomonadota bacterium]MDP2105109.1 SDR family oxidoreductase [Desulfobulbaceae bacterium]
MIDTANPLSGQVAIITGGSIGIGYCTAVALARAGVKVVLVSRDQDRVDGAVAELLQDSVEAEALGLALDVKNPTDMETMAMLTMERFGRIDILITAAGVLRVGSGVPRTLAQMPVTEWDDVLTTNLRGVFLANRAVIPAMLRQRAGQIVNLSSTSGRKGLAFDAAYCASKFGVIGLTESLAEELRTSGIRVHSLLPGAIDTGMWDQNGPLPPPEDLLPPERVAACIHALLLLPEDVVFDAPVIEPLKRHQPPSVTSRRR